MYVFNVIIAYSDVTFHNSWLFSLLFIFCCLCPLVCYYIPFCSWQKFL